MERLLKLLEERPPTIMVVGDVMCDNYILGKINRISPEAPVPVFESTEQFRRLGGAGNVAANLRALGCAVRIIGVVGADGGGRRVRLLLHEHDIPDTWLIEDAARPTTEKTRLVAQQQHVLRLDQETRTPIGAPLTSQVLAHAAALIKEVDCVVCSDYQKGVCSPDVLGPLFALARAAGRPSIVDPKKHDFAHYRGATVLTPNLAEVEQASRLATDDQGALEHAAEILLHQANAQALLVTRGKDGMSLFSPPDAPLHIASEARDVFDVTGAGDTVIATFSVAMMCGLSLAEAARLANVAAGIVVGKVGTAVVSLDELRKTLGVTKVPHSKQLPQHERAHALYHKRSKRMALNNGSER
jgi:D-beta-D-heptose 7-phosphate kinase/D-beta-D-heptose 1-phosphate adenosyltransferase